MLPVKSRSLGIRRYRWYAHQTAVDRRRQIVELIVLLIAVVITHTIAMVVFEGLSPGDALWLTMTTMTTVGYGDLSATSLAGRIVTVVLIYLLGIFLLAQIAGEWIDFRIARRERMRTGQWRWHMKDHIVIINTPEKHGARYLRVLAEQIRRTPLLQDCPIEVLSSSFADGLPQELSALGVVLRHGYPEGRTDLADVDVESARFVLLLAVDEADYRSDSLSLDVLDQLKQFDIKGYVVSECVLESNRARLAEHGADAVIRPVRAYPELMVRAMAAPGSETIFEDLFQHEGNHTRRYDVRFEGHPWRDIAARVLAAGFGTPIAFQAVDGAIVINPKPDLVATGKAIFVIAHQDSRPEPERLQSCVT